ncbi:MAG: hypothetical protein NTY64_12220 [Deltaproteobacteria bacterium]|nr:hypothetical protein [Deltaproteobacteria bacterium]
MKNFKDSSPKKTSSPKSLNDLITLILKLNEKIRGKIVPRSPAKKEAQAGQTDVVIIIMTKEEKEVPAAKKSRIAKGASPKGEWIDDLCGEIEKGMAPRKKS